MPGHLITGGARSGKSFYAEGLAKETEGGRTTYVATSEIRDAEMRGRVERHQLSRPASWRTVEAGAELGAVLEREGRESAVVVIDCVTMWMTRLLAGTEEPESADVARLHEGRSAFCAAIAQSRARVLIVTNELGGGVTPMGRLSRLFVDEHGLMNQHVAAVCADVTLVVCGCPVPLKRGGAYQAR